MAPSKTSREGAMACKMPSLATVLNVYIKDVVDAFYPGDETIVRAIRTKLCRDDKATDEEILEELAPGNDVPTWACKTAIKALAPIEPFRIFQNINEGVQRARPKLQPDLKDTAMVGMPGRIS